MIFYDTEGIRLPKEKCEQSFYRSNIQSEYDTKTSSSQTQPNELMPSYKLIINNNAQL